MEAESTSQVRPAMLCLLRCTTHSPFNRRRAQELVWRWVALKWPRLVPSSAEMERGTFERAAPGQELVVARSGDGRAWRLSLAHTGDRRGRTWLIDVRVADVGSADVLEVQASWTGDADGPLVVAPPRLLGLWVEHLELDDGGVGVIGVPRAVADHQQAQAFCDHVLSDARSLPVIALLHGARSNYYGVDPRALAETLSGLAHVACLTPTVASIVAEQLGSTLGPDSGAARIYAPGFNPLAAADQHPLLRPVGSRVATSLDDPGSFRRRLVQRVCALSVEGAAVISPRAA